MSSMNRLLWLALLFSAEGFAETITTEPDAASYHFVSHYRVQIDAPAEDIWPILIDLKSWMYEFDLTTESGEVGQPGQVLNLYAGQDFKIQITAIEANRMLTMANLPLTFRDEYGTGLGVTTLHPRGSGTEVSLTMSRRYTWNGEGPNPVKAQRSSAEFQSQTRDMWQNRFLGRLKTLAEQRGSTDQ